MTTRRTPNGANASNSSTNPKAGRKSTVTRKNAAPSFSGNEAAAAAEADAAAQELRERKADVRRVALERRQELRPGVRSAKSREICNQLLDALKAAEIKSRNGHTPTLAVYAALRFEVDLDQFIRGAYALCYRITFPCMIPNDPTAGAMCVRSVSCSNYLSGSVPFITEPQRPWGPAVTEEHQTYTSTRAGATRRFIPSRVKGSVPPKDSTRFPVVPPTEIDFMVVPATAFDAEGNRLGYGHGSYDRYLPQLREGCTVVGAAFAEQEVSEVPTEKHDIALPRIITA